MTKDVVEKFDYIAETDKTASGTFNPTNVGKAEFMMLLEQFIILSQDMNKIKKAMFRKQTREEAGLGKMYFDKPLDVDSKYDDLFHGVIGNITEVGEQAEIIAHLLEDGTEPDLSNVREEIGDNLWYLSRLVKFAKTNFLDEMLRNIKKLRARHGSGGFNKERDMNRDLDTEHKVLDE